MADCMGFPDDWRDFLHDYEFKDKQEIYTNGAMLIPSFRVEQMIEHYFLNFALNTGNSNLCKFLNEREQEEIDNAISTLKRIQRQR